MLLIMEVRNSYTEELRMNSEFYYNILTVSTKGQISIPIEIRKAMGLEEGSKLSIYCDGKSVYLKPVPRLTPEEYKKELEASRAWAKEAGITEEDVEKAIKEVRRKKREGRH